MDELGFGNGLLRGSNTERDVIVSSKTYGLVPVRLALRL